MLDIVWFTHLTAFRGAVKHLGDNLTGKGEGDDEQIVVSLAGLPREVAGLVFTINSFRGQRFTEVTGAFCRLVDGRSGAELVRFDLSDSEPRTGVVMAVLTRSGSTWEMRAVGLFHDGRTGRTCAPSPPLRSTAESPLPGLLLLGYLLPEVQRIPQPNSASSSEWPLA